MLFLGQLLQVMEKQVQQVDIFLEAAVDLTMAQVLTTVQQVE